MAPAMPDPDVLVVQHRVAGGQQVDEAEEMPLQLLGEDRAAVEDVPHDDIAEDDDDHREHEPGHAPAEALLKGVDLPGQLTHAGTTNSTRSGQRQSLTPVTAHL